MAQPGALPTSPPAPPSQAATSRATRRNAKPQSQSQSHSIAQGGPQLPPALRQGTTSSTSGHAAGSSRLGDVSQALKRPLSRQAVANSSTSGPRNTSTSTTKNPSISSDSAASGALPRTPPRAAAKPNGIGTPSSVSSYASRQGSTSRSPAVHRGRDVTAPPSSVAALARSLDLSAPTGECSRHGCAGGPAESLTSSLDHQRSLSVKSQISEGTTTDGGSSSGQDSLSFSTNIRGRKTALAAVGMDAADTHSTLERRGSAASTVPTSPDVEPLPPLPWQQVKGSAPLGGNGVAPEASESQTVPTYFLMTNTLDSFDVNSSRETKELPTIDSVGDITHLSATSSASEWEHRNKPLPAVTSDVTEGASASSPVRASESSSRLTAASKASTATSSKGAIRSAFSQGGRYLRSSPLWSQASSRQSSLSPSLGGASPMGSDLSNSPNPSASDLSQGDRNDSSASLHPPPRSHSPFLFRKRSKPQLSGSSDAPTQPKPVPSTSSYFTLRKNPRQNSHASSSGASSDSKRAGSSVADASSAQKSRPPSAASRTSHTLDRSRSRFSQRMSINDTNWSRAPTPSNRSRDPSPPSSIRAHVAIEPLVPKRPPLMRRDRSRSLGEMDKLFKGKDQASEAGHLTVPDGTRASVSARTSPTSQAVRDGAANELAGGLLPPTLPFLEATEPLFPTHDGVQESMRGTGSGAKKSHSFRWSRVLGKRGSISEKWMGQSPEDNTLARAKSSTSPRTADTVLAPPLIMAQSRNQRSPQHAKRPSIYDEGRTEAAPFPGSDKSPASQPLPMADASEPAEESALGLTTTVSADSAHESQGSHAAHLSPNLASLWSSAVGFDFAGRQGEEEPSHYHDAMSAPSSPPRSAPPLESAEIIDAPEYTAPTPPSRRESLGRTLTTMFDPRPSLNGMVPELPRPTGEPALPRSQSSTFGLPQRHARTASKSSMKNVTGMSHSRHGSMAFSNASASTSATNSPMTAKTSLSSSSLADRVPNTPTRRSGMDVPASRQRLSGAPLRPPPPPPKVASDTTLAVNGARNASSSAPSPRIVTAPVPSSVRESSAPPAIRTTGTPETAAQRTRGGAGTTASPKTPPSSNQTTPTKAGKKDVKSTRKGILASAAAPPLSMHAHTKSSASNSTRSSESSGSVSGKNIPSRGSSQPGTRTRTVSQAASPVVHRRAKSKPALSIETSGKDEGMPRAKLARPSSALDMYRRDGQGTFAGKLNQPQVQELDDHAFLQLLEEARRQQKEKAAKREEEADKMARLSSMGMAPTRKARAGGNGDRSVSSGKSAAAGNNAANGAGRPAQHRRSSSADGRLGGRPLAAHRLDLNGSTTGADEQEGGDDDDVDDPQTPSSPVGHFSVGKASGQLNSAFANDDDWKREVRALFVIRELLNTEQSYARHLESLLLAVRRKAMTASSSLAATPPRRKSVGGLGGVSAASSSLTSKSALTSGGATDRHLPLMRNLLPQLIALSRSLSLRIDGNPTAAGVGSAFSIIAPQLEATFVAWSSAANEIMTSLRYTQGPKGKSKDKLVLAPVVDTDTSVFKSAVAQQQSSIARSQPSSPKKSKSRMSIDALALTRPSSPIEPDVGPSSSGFPPPSSRTTKRRSTISSVTGVRISPAANGSQPPSAVGTLAASTLSQSPSAVADEFPPVQPPSRPASPWGFAASTKRSIAAAAAASRPGGGMRSKKLSSSQSSMDISSVMSANGSTVSDGASSSLSKASSKGGTLSGNGSVTPNGMGNGGPGSATPQPQAKATKALSPLDVAIMPMQRPPRYLLLLTELVRNTPPESVSHARVVKSLEIVRAIARKCDEASGTGAGIAVSGPGGGKGGGASLPSSAGPAVSSFH